MIFDIYIWSIKHARKGWYIMKIISIVVCVVTLFSIFSVATPVLAGEINNIDAISSCVDINDNDSLEPTTTPPSETPGESGAIYDPEIDTAIDPCEFCCEDDSVSYDNSGVATVSSANDLPTEKFIDFTVNSLSSTNTDFQEMFDKSIFAKEGESYDISNEEFVYYVMQGSCTDGDYYYFGYLVKERYSISEDRYAARQIDSGVLCVQKTNDGSYINIANHRFSELDLSEYEINHVNDLTYNSNIDKIVVACCVAGYHNKLYLISPEQLQSVQDLANLEDEFVSCKVASIDYNETRNAYVVGLSGTINKFAILDNDFDVVKVVGFNNYQYEKPIEDSEGYERRWTRQSCCADNLRIYSISFYSDERKNLTYTNENMVRVFDWNGNYIKTIRINVTNGVDKIYESENIFMDDDDVIIGFNCLRSRNLDYYSLNLSELMFHVQYCPDENVDEYIGEFDNGNASSLIIRGVETPLLKQRISITGKKFLGWTAYRAEANMWFYCLPDGSDRHWYVEGQQPEGHIKYIYKDKQGVSKTGYCGEHVLMCAQWEDTNKFYISFHSSATPGTVPTQEVTYGVSTPLRANTFTKTNRSFQGWNAYWAEKNKWYYEDTNSDTKGWYTEGEQPVGFKKYLYANKQSVAGTAYAGGHIQMHALWDEFTIQYNSRDKIIANANILPQKTAHYLTGNTNKLSFFVVDSSMYQNNIPKIDGYYLYRREINKWYYQSTTDSHKVWCYKDQQPEGYELYVKEKPLSGNAYLGATALPGEHLVLYAKWD